MIDDNGNSILPFENYVVIAFLLNDDYTEGDIQEVFGSCIGEEIPELYNKVKECYPDSSVRIYEAAR